MTDVVHPAINQDTTAVIVGWPIHSLLTQFPVVCFTLTLLTDISYWLTANLMWQNFSSWLLFAGLVVGGLAVAVGIIDLGFRKGLWTSRPVWAYTIGSLTVLLLAFLNSLMHAGDGWTAVVPWGLTISSLTGAAMIVTYWFGRSLVFIRQTGGAYHV